MNLSTLTLVLATAQEWTCLLPALVAVLLAVVLRSVLPALFLAVWCGVLLLQPAESSYLSRVGTSFLETVAEVLPRQIAPVDGEADHVEILLFTLFLGCTIGVMRASGGTEALVVKLTPLTGSRRGGQITTWIMGMVIFFDDYANALLVGGTMRPVTDRLKISREKLAFLVDATAAPVAGVAIVSTWVGFEVGIIRDSFEKLAVAHPDLGLATDGYSTLLATLPYRFYPVLMILFVGLIAWLGRDFGSMRTAEQRSQRGHATFSASGAPMQSDSAPKKSRVPSSSMWNAILPLIVLFAALLVGFWWTGLQGLEPAERSLWRIVSNSESSKTMLVSSFLASLSAVIVALATRTLSLMESVDAWLEGAKSMLLGCAVLVLAWAIAFVCDAEHLNTAGYLVEQTRSWLQPVWLPTVTFLLSGAIAFATGSSWATMGLVIPLVIEVVFARLSGDEAALAAGVSLDRHPLMLASIGGVLAGSIFGDHCSPISDTTVLSSIAADCDHVAHVATQMPYAVTVAVIAVVCGCLPVGFDVPWWLSLPVGAVFCLLAVRYLGRPLSAP